ncbi:peptidase M20 [Kitasatospora cheerisanensis KCTC 2395]|uniref:Peptidase M20 n=1 Tax=Kitasatospora cheerisanensis KCTC 2395 TaxID=1348663 RepID=A0A066Z336_9ACTN|nr:peptidase M20 [Kitasatospora cheerisanensis KCTC 2395]
MPDEEPAFTCDAIWAADLPDAFTVVLGPGDLGANRAHAEGEFAELAQLEGFASAVARLLVAFARRRCA